MSRRIKAVIIKNICGVLEGVDDVLVVDSSRSTGVQANGMRRALRKCGLNAIGVKSHLAKVGSVNAGRSALVVNLHGPVTLVYGGEDLFALCRDVNRILPEYGAVILGGYATGSAIDAALVKGIATGRSCKEWIGEVVASMLAPGVELVSLLSSPGSVLASQIERMADATS